MKAKPKAIIDSRDDVQIVQLIKKIRSGFVPEWLPESKSIGDALQWIFSRYLEAIIQRLNQTPDKNLLAFLDLMGIDLIPAQASRAPVVFQLADGATDSRIPAGTKIAAPPPPEETDQVVFETEQTAGIAAAKLMEVVSFWPGRDQFADHSSDYKSGQSFELFKSLKDTSHVIYLAHDTLLAFAGKTRIDVELELLQISSEHLDILWEYWDGKVWRGFKDMNPACGEAASKLDGTYGLTKSGKYHLETDCAETKKTIVNGTEAFWIRGRLTEPMPADPGKILPEVDGIRISSVVEKTLVDEKDENGNLTGGKIGMLPDKAFMDKSELDLTQSFYPFGQQPLPGSVFYFTSEEIFSKPGAKVELTIERTKTPQDNIGTSGPPAILLIGAIPSKIRANGIDQSWIIIFVKDAKQMAVKDGTQISLRTTKGSLNENLLVITNGVATTYITSNEIGCAVITAVCDNIQGSTGVEFLTTEAEVELVDSSTALSRFEKLRNVNNITGLTPKTKWEYWDGIRWVSIPDISPIDFNLNESKIIKFSVPLNISKTKVNDEEGYWFRVRLVSGSYGYKYTVTWKVDNTINEFTYYISQPPALSKFQLGYIWEYGPFHAEHVLTYNDFQYEDETYNAKWPGKTYQPFRPPADVTPTVYLGFDKKLPNDYFNIFFNVEEYPDQIEGPQMVWEYYNGSAWRPLLVEDETGNLTLPGMVSFIAPADAGQLARFGTNRYWVRGRLKEDGPPAISNILGLYPNAVWVQQVQTITNENLGLGSGLPNMVLVTRHKPILAEEYIEIQELQGAMAGVEWRILARELFWDDSQIIDKLEKLLNQPDSPLIFDYEDLRFIRDANRKITGVWVRWQQQPHLFYSKPDGRHYMIDRTRGRIIFGDGEYGKIPPAAAEIRARRYRTGGGSVGNVKANEITQLLSGATAVQSVYNPLLAEGGADVENIDILKQRGPRTLRYRNRALTANDYETMALEANPAVAVARALPTRDSEGRSVPGWVTLVIIPKSKAPRPWPSAGLRQKVRDFIEQRTAADLAAQEHIHVTGPKYTLVSVSLTVAPVNLTEAGIVETCVRKKIQQFFHPLHGGPEELGWEPGRDVYLSDVAAVIERVEGVDYVSDLALLQDGLTQGDRVRIAPDRITVAGNIFLKMKITE